MLALATFVVGTQYVDPSTGNARLTTFPAGGTTGDQQQVHYEGTSNTATVALYRLPDRI
jgi:hypothetical protein